MDVFLATVLGLFEGNFGTILQIVLGCTSILCLKIWLPVVALRVNIFWALGVLLVPFVDILFAILHWRLAKKPFVTGYVCLVFAFCIWTSRVLIGTFFSTSGSESFSADESYQSSKPLAEQQAERCSQNGIAGSDCAIIDSKIKRISLRDAFVTFLASQCGDTLKRVITRASIVSNSINTYLLEMNSEQMPTPRGLLQLRGVDLGATLQCGEALMILQQEFWLEAKTLNALTALEGESLRFGDSKLWDHSFPTPGIPPTYSHNQSQKEYLQNLIFIFLVHNEAESLPSSLRHGLESQEFSFLFEQIRRDQIKITDNN